MNIDPNLNINANDVTQRANNTPGSTATQAAGSGAAQANPATDGDHAHISTQAQQASQLSKALANVPDIRQSQVQALQASIQQGTYGVTNQQIAQSMVNDMQTGRAGIR